MEKNKRKSLWWNVSYFADLLFMGLFNFRLLRASVSLW
jgi:hypothetical protein